MDIEFLGQGLSPNKADKPVGKVLLEEIRSGQYTAFLGFVAFLSRSGAEHITLALNGQTSLRENSHLFVGIDLKGTSKEALQVLLAAPIKTSIFYTPSRMVFHPKLYLFEGPEKRTVIVGSNNLTGQGLFTNAEASVRVSFGKNDEPKLINEIAAYYQPLVEGTDPNAMELDQGLLTTLADMGLLPNEAERVAAAKSEKTDTSARQSIESLFPSRPTSPAGLLRPRPGPGSILRGPSTAPRPAKTPAAPPANAVSEPNEAQEIAGPAIWFETRAMTGGSRNQLDLSMRGQRGRRGSVSLFGLGGHNKSQSKEITIRYQGDTYQRNPIYYPLNSTGKTNGTWRLQLNGTTSRGRALTNHTRDGQLADKLLVFKSIGPDSYELFVEPKSKIDVLKAKSSFWDHGPGGNGRAYGEIAG